MKHYRIRTETAVVGSELPCVVCGTRDSELAIIPIGLPPVAGLHKRCIDKLHRKRGEQEETSDRAAESPVAPTTTPAGGSEEAGFPKDTFPGFTPEERAAFVQRAIDEKILPAGIPVEDAWHRLQFAAPKGWFKKMPGERIDLLQLGLAERGVEVKLPDLCAWSVIQRDVARAWLEQGGDRPGFFPGACAACDNGIPNEGDTAYKHTGEGEKCRPAQADGKPKPKRLTIWCASCGVEIDQSKPYTSDGNSAYCSVECHEKNIKNVPASTSPVGGVPATPASGQQGRGARGSNPQEQVAKSLGSDTGATYLEAGRVCAREGCGKTVEERNSTRVGDELFCSAACGLPKGLAAVAKTPAAERTVPLPLPQAKPKFDDQW